MHDSSRTNQELFEENASLKLRIQELEIAEEERKRSEEALKQSETQYRLLADHMKDHVWLMDLNLKPTYISPSVEKSRGYTFEEIVQLPLDKHLTAKSLQSAIEFFSIEMPKALADPAYYLMRSLELEFYRKDGSTLWLENMFSLIRDKNGKPMSLLSVGRDITDQKQAEEARRESEKKYRELYDFLPIPVYEMDFEANMTSVNRAIYETFGGTEEDFRKGFKGWQFLSTEDIDKSNKNIERLLKGEQIGGTEYTLMKLDGSTFPAIVISSLIYSNDKPVGLRGAIVDITERKQAEIAMRKSEERFRSLVETTSDWIWELDTEGRYTYASPRIYDLLGFAPEEVLGRTPFDFIAPHERERIATAFAHIIAERQPFFNLENVNLHKDGHTVVIETSGVPKLDPQGIFLGYQGIDRDITDRKQSEGALQKSEERYRTLVDNASDMIYKTDENGFFTLLNPAALRFTGYKAEEIIGKHYKMIVRPDTFKKAITFFADQLIKRIPNTYYEYPILTKDGHEFWVGQNMQLIMDDDRVTGFQAVARDITDRRQAEEALRESEEKYRWAMDNIADVITVIDMDLRFTYVSPSIMRMRGYTAEEAAAQTFEQAMTPESLQLSINAFEEEMKLEATGTGDPGRNRILELEQYRKDGSTVWMENSLSFMRDNAQKPVSMISVSRDITDRKRAEAKLRESEEKYRNILESIEDGYYEVDLVGNFTFFNPSMCTILGYDRAEMPGMNNRVFMDHENAKKVFQAFNEVYAYGIPKKGFEWEIIQKSGARRHIEVSVSLITHPGAKPIGFRGIARDITEKRRAEEALWESEKKYRSIFENAIEGIYQSTPAGRFLSVNPYLATICGYESPEDMVQSITDIATQFYVDPKDRLLFREILEGDGRIENCEYRVQRKDRSIIWISNNAHCVHDTTGCILYYEGALVDVTDRKEAERELEIHRYHLEELVRERTKRLEREIAEHRRTEQDLRSAKEVAEEANRAKSAFLSSMSHELRTPLTSIIGFSDVLDKKFFGPLNDKQQEYVQDISASGHHLLSLINDVLDLAKIEAGKTDLYCVHVSLQELLEESLFMIKEKTRLQGIEVHMQMEERFVDLKLKADVRRLKQVMYNLLSNAAKFTPDGGRITVTTRVVDETASKKNGGGEFVEVSVTDTGIGLGREDLETIFEEFHQVNTPAMGKNPGTGLGLALVRRIVEMHGGRIWAESAGLNHGSTFIFQIPCAPLKSIS